MKNKKFKEPLNTAVITNKNIISDEGFIGYVTHDLEDGGWQFLEANKIADEKNAVVVGLGEIVRIDPSVLDLADLPVGWTAWRETKDSAWLRDKVAE